MEPVKKKDNKWFIKAIVNVLFGIPIGIANIIPGVSGGTFGVMLGIYDKLISSISNIRKDFKNSIKFLIPVVIGMGIGIVGFNWILGDVLLKHFPMQTITLFMGLVVGSIPLVFRHSGIKKATPGSIIPGVVTLVFMVALPFIMQGDGGSYDGFTLGVGNGVMIFLCGIIASVTMILPGISGSMMLMVMGYYFVITGALGSLTSGVFSGNLNLNDILVLGIFVVGVLVGLLGGAKVIDICLKRFRIPTYSAIIGLVVGSLYQIYLESGFTLDLNGLFAVLTFIAGALIALFFGSKWLEAKMEKFKKD
ncbi:MAG: DUF368 domain-containing protein [Clostridia bacterium]|nr:DUF368 domain-containing protein [Clostridia bacterium]